MAKAKYSWPSSSDAKVIGKSHIRLDGMEKSTGAAKYTYDINLKDMLIAKALGSPHAHAKVTKIDTRAASKVPGVVNVHVLRQPGYEINWEGDLLVMVAGETEAAAAEGVSKLNVEYEELDVYTDCENLEAAIKAGRASNKPAGSTHFADEDLEPGDDEDEDEFEQREIERLFQGSKYEVEGYYGIDAITHCCLEPHGATVYWDGNKLKAYLSTQNVSGTDDGFARDLELTADDVDVTCNYIGGGFGSKFAPDYWSVAAAKISKETGRPVQFMLDRDQELKNAGNRPSGYINVRLGADKDGIVQVWDSHHWGTTGFQGRRALRVSLVPYIFRPPNYRRKVTPIKTNTAQSRAWRAPDHPQVCAITQTAYDDLAAKMGVSSLEIFQKNLKHIDSNQTAEVYAEELKIAAKLIDWDAKWHAHGKGPSKGSIVEGLGIGLHTWGGGANSSTCQLKIYPDGGVESFCGTQDLGTGTRTICAMVLAETFGLPVEAMKVNIGSSTYPASGASGGSTTVGAVSESHRRVSQDALMQIFAKVAGKLNVDADSLEAVGGRIRVKGNADKSLSWKESCSLLGLKPLEITTSYSSGSESPLSSRGVGGVQMAHVAVDKETGVVKIKKFVAVQDMGLIINRKLAASQIYGAVIMEIAYALFEQRLTDPLTGAFINAELSEYKLPRLGDIGDIVVELYEPESERSRGVIGLGEPPVISGGAAISNAVANALGVRVPVLPLTPKRVTDALNKAGRA